MAGTFIRQGAHRYLRFEVEAVEGECCVESSFAYCHCVLSTDKVVTSHKENLESCSEGYQKAYPLEASDSDSLWRPASLGSPSLALSGPNVPLDRQYGVMFQSLT
jgi:hypothetical protein